MGRDSRYPLGYPLLQQVWGQSPVAFPAAIESAEAALRAGDVKGAMAAMSKVPADAYLDPPLDARAEAVRKQLDAAAEQALADAGPLTQSGRHARAVSRLKDVEDGPAGLAGVEKAKRRLAELTAKPEVKAAVAKAEREKQADAALAAALAAARKLKDEHKDDQAYAAFKAAAKDYPDAPAGTEAAGAVSGYDKDPVLRKRAAEAAEAAAGAKAPSALRLAQSYATAGRADLARKKYQEVISHYPGTSYAEQAKKAIGSLAK